MNTVPGRMKRLESVISICLLAVLILIGVGIFLKQSNYDLSQYGVDTNPHIIVVSENHWVRANLGFFAVPKGFNPLGETEIFNPDNLYEKINGKAPLYTETGFEKLFTQRFAETSDPNLWMEVYIYDMGEIKNAFCVYSVQRRDDCEVFPSMQFAYETSNALYFVHGKYYIEIVGSSESGELFKATAEVAQRVKTNLAVDPNAGIAELSFFPQENLVADSFKLYVASAFGFDKLTDIFTARYKVGNETITAFISKKADSKEAKAIAESYCSFLIENGAVIKNTTNKAFASKVMESYGTTEIVFTVGTFVAGVHEAENQERGEKLAEILFNKLNSLKNE